MALQLVRGLSTLNSPVNLLHKWERSEDEAAQDRRHHHRRVIEREGPWRRPQDFFPAYDDAVFNHHLAGIEHEVIDTALG